MSNQTQGAFDGYGQDDLFTMNVIEPVNLTKYTIAGEQTRSFIYGMKDEAASSTTGEQMLITKHNGTLYTFTFLSPAEDFDTPELSEIREHMIQSIRWLS